MAGKFDAGNGNTRQNIRRILARLAELDPAARSDAAARLVILAQLRRAVPAVVEEVTEMGNLTFDIKDHPVLNDIFEKGVLEGEARGEARGRAETLLRLLRKRYGAVPDATVERIHTEPPAEWASGRPRPRSVKQPGIRHGETPPRQFPQHRAQVRLTFRFIESACIDSRA